MTALPASPHGTIPAKCDYRSLILTNELYETTDWVNNHSSLNGAQAAPDPDGKLRIVVSPRDPGVRNWLDTAGYPTGVIQGRWTGCDSQPIPTTKKVKHRTAVRDWSVAIPLTHDWESSNALVPGARSDEDPSYGVLGTRHGVAI